MSWSARPASWGVPGHANRGTEYEAVLDRIELLSSMPRAVKTADTDVTSNTTAADDPHLQITLKAGVSYDIMGVLITEGNTAGDLKIQWAWTPTSTGTEANMGGIGLIDSATTFTGDAIALARADVTTSPTATTTIGINSGTWTNYIACGHVLVGSVDITFKLQWAQNASNATATRLKAGSWLRAFPAFT